MTENRIAEIRALLWGDSVIMRSSQLRSAGIYSRDVKELIKRGYVARLKDGYYVWRDAMDQLSDYQIAVATIPNATICFLSAAVFYGFTTIIPDAVHVAIPNKGKLPKKPCIPPIELVRYKPTVFLLGRDKADTESGKIPIYDRERTVCDCLKRRNEIGDDIALEVVRNYMRGKKDIQKLYSYAQTLRIRHKLHPYVEALI